MCGNGIINIIAVIGTCQLLAVAVVLGNVKINASCIFTCIVDKIHVSLSVFIEQNLCFNSVLYGYLAGCLIGLAAGCNLGGNGCRALCNGFDFINVFRRSGNGNRNLSDIEFVQDNRSFSAEKGTLRGLHCQKDPTAQSKLLTCTRGEIMDVAVDIRKGSPTYMKYAAVNLSGENKKSFFIPKGCLHGFVTLTDNVEVMYKVDKFYSPENDRSVKFDDPELGVEWNIENPILSQKDKNAPLFKDSDVKFTYKG